jgi:hypothetical protein
MTTNDKIGLTALSGVAIWTFVALPLIYLPTERVKELAGALPTIAPVFTAIAAVGAATIAYHAWRVAHGQLNLSLKNQRETTAKTNFRDFLKLCVDHPDLAFGQSGANPQQYEWFVAEFLWAAEEILEFAPDPWERTLRLHIAHHRKYLEKDTRFRTHSLPTYTPRLQEFIAGVLRELPPADPQQAATDT